MIRLSSHRLLTGLSLAGLLAATAACSGPSSLTTPTGPSAVVNNSAAATAVSFSPNPGDPVDGRFTGGGFQIGEVRVTRGFTIHCDNLLTNNLEVNWPDGNNFHMEQNGLTSVVCTRPDTFDPTPPASPVSRIVATANGTCNNLPAVISFILEDHGEPGNEDQAQLIIEGGCSLDLPLSLLDGGNIQAHFDQPHK